MKQFFFDLFCQLGGGVNSGTQCPCVYYTFALKALFFGLLTLLTDFCVYKITNKSYLKVNYQHAAWKVFLCWPVGSLAVGYLVAVFSQSGKDNLVMAMTAGASWPVIFGRLVSGKFNKD